MLSPARTYYSEKARQAAGLGQAGRFRVNVQIGLEQFHVVIQMPETRTFNYIMDELQPMFHLSEYQRFHTRIFLQTILGETEILVNSRPNYTTERHIDYVGIPLNPIRVSSVQRRAGSWRCLAIFMLIHVLALGAFLAVEFFVLRPRLVAAVRREVANRN